ncbi:YncE family protein (plasmid) [Spirosoma sp. SC4-14]|uniref:YncE family protein n=1 Tax=Spirosoma sp. SC4-14 TaxID=3128900 RepID=UPI0030CF0127
MITFIKKISLAVCLTGTYTLPILAQTTPNYAFIEKISLPSGDGKWDYLKMDGERERLFVSHFDRVHVIDLTTNKQIGEITGLKGVHGIGLAKDLNKGYITNGTDNTITVFDYNTFKVLQTIPVTGKKADAVMYDKGTKRIFVFNNGSGDAIAIDAVMDKVVGTVTMGGAPEFAVANEKGSIFNNNEDTNEIFEIDAKALTVKNKYSVAPNGGVPTGIAFDASTNRLFSVCRKPQALVILDASTGKIVQSLPIGSGVDAVVYEKELKLIMTSNGEGNVTIIHQDSPDKYSVVQTLTTKPGLKTMVHRGTTHRIYLSGADYQADGKTPAPGTFGVYVYGPAVKQ